MIAEIDPFALAAAAAFAAVISFALCRAFARSRLLLDAASLRSSHAGEVSRAGGLAILAGFIVGAAILAAFGARPAAAAMIATFVAGALAAGALGLRDDRKPLSAGVKMAGQIFIAASYVAIAGGFRDLPEPLYADPTFLFLASTLWIVGFMNVFNFMDGVNGMASGAAMTALTIFAGAGFAFGAPVSASLGVALIAALSGFAPINAIRGRLFMGDAGSLMIGFAIAAIAIMASRETFDRLHALLMPAMFAPFIADVAVTLAARLRRGENVFQAHREHLYQALADRPSRHLRTALHYMAAIAICASIAWLSLALAPPGPAIAAALALLGALAAVAMLRARIYEARAIDVSSKRAKACE